MIRSVRCRMAILIVAMSPLVFFFRNDGVASSASLAPTGEITGPVAPKDQGAVHTERETLRAAARIASASDATFAQLATAADAGDVRAACTLGMLLELCVRRAASEEFGHHLLEGAASSDPGTQTELMLAARVQAIENAHRRYGNFCASLKPEESAQSHARMLQATRLGSSHAALRFFLSPQLKSGSGTLSLNRAADYNAHAVDGLHRAAEEGDALAMKYLFELLATGEYKDNEIALSVDVQRGKAIALGRAVLPVLHPPSAAVAREMLQKLEAHASPEEHREARLWSSRFRLDSGRSSLDALPDVTEHVSNCGTE